LTSANGLLRLTVPGAVDLLIRQYTPVERATQRPCAAAFVAGNSSQLGGQIIQLVQHG